MLNKDSSFTHIEMVNAVVLLLITVGINKWSDVAEEKWIAFPKCPGRYCGEPKEVAWLLLPLESFAL